MLSLGPMPDTVRALVRQLVMDACTERLNGFLLTGGPGGCSYLDADGQSWNWSAWDESVEAVPDSPLKVGLVVFAAERVPGLASWLPVRPPGAADCGPCRGSSCRRCREYSARSASAWGGLRPQTPPMPPRNTNPLL